MIFLFFVAPPYKMVDILKKINEVFLAVEEGMTVEELASKTGKNEYQTLAIIKQLRKLKLIKRRKSIFEKKRIIQLTTLGVSVQEEVKQMYEALDK